VAGFRISASVALLLVVSAEMIGAETGIGAFVLQAGNLMQTDQLMAGVVVLSILGLAVARGVGALEVRVTRWRGGAYREASTERTWAVSRGFYEGVRDREAHGCDRSGGYPLHTHGQVP